MQPAHQPPQQKYLPFTFTFLFVLLMIIGTHAHSLWLYLALLLLLTVLLAALLYNRGIRGQGRAVLIAGACISSVAVVLITFLLAAQWSWWLFGVVALGVVWVAFRIERYLRGKYPTFFTHQQKQ